MNRIVKLIRKHGVLGTISIVLNTIVYYICRMLPLDGNLMVMESDGDLCDNSYAFYDYLKTNGYLMNYHIVWLVYDSTTKERIENVTYANKKFTSFSIRKNIYLATCKWYIFDHINIYEKLNKRTGTTIINLCHGTTFKMGTNKDIREKDIVDILVSTSDFWIKYTADFYAGMNERVVPLGYPRNDYFFKKPNNQVIEYTKEKEWDRFKKVFFWMPTFRRSIIEELSEDYFINETGLPVLEKMEDLELLNIFLRTMNILIVFKVHHLQSNYESFKRKYSHIQILKDDELEYNGLQLYQLVALSDALITDYSSIGNDYLLLDRPMIYTLDDYEEYRASRGFSIDDPAQYFPGHHVYDKEQLFNAIRDISDGKDPYKRKRDSLLPVMHKYQDGNSCRRIADYIGL